MFLFVMANLMGKYSDEFFFGMVLNQGVKKYDPFFRSEPLKISICFC